MLQSERSHHLYFIEQGESRHTKGANKVTIGGITLWCHPIRVSSTSGCSEKLGCWTGQIRHTFRPLRMWVDDRGCNLLHRMGTLNGSLVSRFGLHGIVGSSFSFNPLNILSKRVAEFHKLSGSLEPGSLSPYVHWGTSGIWNFLHQHSLLQTGKELFHK